MELDLNTYLINKIFIQKWYQDHKEQGVVQIISVWSAATHCPCIVLAFYLSEDIGFTTELVRIIDRLIEFYDYRFIKNQSPRSPYLTMDPMHDIKK